MNLVSVQQTVDKIDPGQTTTCILPYCKECGGAYMMMLLMFVIIVFYFFILSGAYTQNQIVFNDPMNYKVFDFPLLENCCSWWPLSHFIFFFILGVLFPDCAVPLLSLGVLWEGFEMLQSSIQGAERQWVRGASKSSDYEYSGNWWAGSLKDIVMNTLGFGFGWLVAKKLNVKLCINGVNSSSKWCKTERYCDKDQCKGYFHYI